MQTEYIPAPRIEQRCGGEDVSSLGAFPKGSVIEITARIPRSLGITSAELCIRRDTLAPCDENKDASVQSIGFVHIDENAEFLSFPQKCWGQLCKTGENSELSRLSRGKSEM